MRTPSSISSRAWLSCAVLLLTVSGYAAEEPSRLQTAKDCYRDADFQQAVSLLHEAVQDLEPQRDVQSARSQLADAYLHLALSYCALGDAEAGKDAFRKLLGIDRSRRLDRAVYAPKVVDLFERARLSLPPEPDTAGSSAPRQPSLQRPPDRWLTLEWARQQARLSSREPFAGLGEMPFDPARDPVDLRGRVSPDGPAHNTQYVRMRLPWALGDVTLERRSEVRGGFSVWEPEELGPHSEGDLPTTGDSSASLDSKSVVWSRPFRSGTTLWRRPFQHRWELGYRHVSGREALYQDWWVQAHRRGHRTTQSDLSIHGARGGLATALDLGRGWTVDLGLGGTLFFRGHDEFQYRVYLPGGEEKGATREQYGLKVQGQIEARLQWDVVRLRRGALHVAVTAYHEWGGPAGGVQPDATIATRGVSAVIGLDLGPPSSSLTR